MDKLGKYNKHTREIIMKRLKVNESTRYDDTAIQKLMALVEQYGKVCKASGGYKRVSKGTDASYYGRRQRELLEDIKAHAESFMSHAVYNGKEEFEESGVESDGWFDEIGQLVPPDWAIDEFGIDPDKSPLPDECVRACSHPGRVDDDVSAWVDELRFD